jgi:hypothetical protein
VLHHSTVLANLQRALQPSVGHRQPARLYLGFGGLIGHSKARLVEAAITVIKTQRVKGPASSRCAKKAYAPRTA